MPSNKIESEKTIATLYSKMIDLQKVSTQKEELYCNPHVRVKDGFQFKSYTERYNEYKSRQRLLNEYKKDLYQFEFNLSQFIISLNKSECDELSEQSLQEVQTLLSHEYKNAYLKPNTQFEIQDIETLRQNIQRMNSNESGYRTTSESESYISL